MTPRNFYLAVMNVNVHDDDPVEYAGIMFSRSGFAGLTKRGDHLIKVIAPRAELVLIASSS